MADVEGAGRIDSSMLTDAQMLDLFLVLDDGEGLETLLGEDEPDEDICEWLGIACNSESQINEIIWMVTGFGCDAELHMRYMPRRVESFVLVSDSIYGEVDLLSLPTGLQKLIVFRTRLSGTLDFGHLPRTMQNVQFEQNKITSVHSICNLPETLKTLVVREQNIREERIYIGMLPKGLEPDFSQCGLKGVDFESEKDRYNVKWMF